MQKIVWEITLPTFNKKKCAIGVVNHLFGTREKHWCWRYIKSNTYAVMKNTYQNEITEMN